MRFKSSGALAFAFAAVFLVATPAPAANTIDIVMETLSTEIARYLNNNGQQTIAVDSFDSPSNAGTNLQIERRLKEHLGKSDRIDLIDETAIVRPDCWSIRGSYAIRDRGESTIAEVTARIFNEDNVEQHAFVPFPFNIDDVTDLTVISAASYDVEEASKSDGIAKSTNVAKTLTSAIASPNVAVSGDGRITPTATSPYGIELLICDGKNFPPKRKDYESAPQRIEKKEFKLKDGVKGFAIADLQPGEFYAVKLSNDSDHDAAVRLCVDGLSSFEFSEVASYKKTDHWIVPKHSTGTVFGWHRTNDHSDSFEIAHLPDTAVGKSGRSASRIGIIQAVFFRAWAQGETPPEGEITRGGLPGDALGTKQGDEIQTSYAETRRFTGRNPVAAVCVRYAKPLDDLPPPMGD